MSTNCRRILIVGPGPDYLGGISTYISELREYLSDSSYKIDQFDHLNFRKNYEPGIKSRFTIKNIIDSLTMMRKYKSLLKSKTYQIIHIHCSSYWGFYEKIILGYIAKRKGAKVIFHIHGGNFINFFKKSKLKYFLKKALSNFSAVIVPTKKMGKLLDLSNLFVIHNGIKLPIIKKSNIANKIVFLSLSVLEKRKRNDMIISAAEVLSRKRNDFQVIIAGDGPEKSNIISTINNRRLSKYVKYIGLVKGREKEEVFEKSNVFILASTAESFGLTVIEAMSYGLCVISTPVGISEEVIYEGKNGFLFNIDSLSELIEKMELILQNKKIIKEMKDESIKTSKMFSWETISDQIINIYRQIIGEDT